MRNVFTETKTNSRFAEVYSNNRTTWVCVGGLTVGRFCPISAEYMGPDGVWEVLPNDGDEDVWRQFQQLLWDGYQLPVPDSARPMIREFRMEPMKHHLKKVLTPAIAAKPVDTSEASYAIGMGHF